MDLKPLHLAAAAPSVAIALDRGDITSWSRLGACLASVVYHCKALALDGEITGPAQTDYRNKGLWDLFRSPDRRRQFRRATFRPRERTPRRLVIPKRQLQ